MHASEPSLPWDMAAMEQRLKEAIEASEKKIIHAFKLSTRQGPTNPSEEEDGDVKRDVVNESGRQRRKSSKSVVLNGTDEKMQLRDSHASSSEPGVRRTSPHESGQSVLQLFGTCDFDEHDTSPRRTIAMMRNSMTTAGSERAEFPARQCPAGIAPHSKTFFIIELLSMLVMLHDSIVLPYIVAMQMLELPKMLQALQTSSMVFWTLDMAFNFVKGYYTSEGSMEARIPVIAKQYLRSWFLFDLLINSLDWAGKLLEGMKFRQVPQVGRFFRTVRILRLVKIANRARQRMNVLTERTLVAEVLQILVAVLWLNHIMGCMWLGADHLGQSHGFPITWRQTANNGVRYEESSEEFQYLTALHWAMSQMTPGSMEVFPTNSLERSCNIFCLLCCLLFASSLVSVLSAKMIEFKMFRQQEMKQMDELRQFFHAHHVEGALAQRIFHHVAIKVKSAKPLVVDNVMAVKLLSNTLRQELHSELFRDKLLRYPIVFAWPDDVIRRLIRFVAVTHTVLKAEEELFTASTSPDVFYLFMQGHLRFSVDPTESSQTVGMTAEVEEGTWLAEPALWMQWKHRGTVHSVADSVLLILKVGLFRKALKSEPQIASFAGDWARAFAKTARLQQADIDYFDIGGVEHSYVVMEMSQLHRARLQDRCLDSLAEKFTVRVAHMGSARRCGDYDKVADEVYDGECILIPNGTGKMQRHLFIVALEMKRGDDEFLCQIANYHPDTGAEQFVKLPGSKLSMGQDPEELRNKLLAQILGASGAQIHWQDAAYKREEHSETKPGGLSLVSRYHRFVHTGVLEDECKIAFGQSLQPPPADLIASREVSYVDSTNGRKKVYAWITSEEMVALSGYRQGDLNHYLASVSEALADPVLLVSRSASVKAGSSH
eukprot:TRINITY_DN13482_c0_g1_i1.p1 TRINITY_DN13482_c0_g1~~TRINITY_DN13482_c0_g1_i1.p1  ORF type:complete len:899 (+),score=149.28 TRINITY_DN13482_c0_g1_i1:42-2699(+)